jgi:hypothetical protein
MECEEKIIITVDELTLMVCQYIGKNRDNLVRIKQSVLRKKKIIWRSKMRSYSNKELTLPSYVELIFVLKKLFANEKDNKFVLLVIGQTNSCVLETKKHST